MTAAVLLLGGSGLVGTCVRQRWADSFEVEAPTHADLDVLDREALGSYMKCTSADVVLNCAAWADVDGAEPQRGDTSGVVYQLNVEFPRWLAQYCRELGKHLVHVSTDYVFDGANDQQAYRENDATHPLGWYAETKLLGEQAIHETGAAACIARIEMPFTGHDHPKRDLARLVEQRLRAGQTMLGVNDQNITPVFLDDAADALRELITQRYVGLIHVASSGWTTPYAFATSIAKRFGLDAELIQPEPFQRFAATRPAMRPQHSWLDTRKFERQVKSGVLRTVDDELDAWATQFSSVVSRT